MKIKDVIASRARHVEVIGRITKKEPVILRTRRLEKATLEDETASIILNLWGPQTNQCQEGDLVKVIDAFVRSHGGVMELNTWKDIEVLERTE